LTAGPTLTSDAERLIARHVDSVGVLDLLLLLRGEPSRVWTRDGVACQLACPLGWAERELERLRHGGFARAEPGGYQRTRARRGGQRGARLEARSCSDHAADLLAASPRRGRL